MEMTGVQSLTQTKVHIQMLRNELWYFPGGAVVKNPPANAGDTGSIPGREDPTCHRATKPVHLNY